MKKCLFLLFALFGVSLPVGFAESLPDCTIAVVTTLPLEFYKDDVARHISDYLRAKPGVSVLPCEQDLVTGQPIDCSFHPTANPSELTIWAKKNHADFVLLIDAFNTNSLTACSIALIDTESGLRLTDHTWIWSQERIPKILQDAEMQLTIARKKAIAPDIVNVAVPPFECRDLGFSSRYLQEPLATILQHILLGYQDVRTVEWKSVQMLLGDADNEHLAKRDWPVMIKGSYVTMKQGGESGVVITIELRQAGKTLATKTLPFIRTTDLPQLMPAYVYEMFIAFRDHLSHDYNAREEVQDIEEYAATNFELGNFKSAWVLSESALLIQSGSVPSRIRAIKSLCLFAEADPETEFSGQDIPVDPDERRLWASEMAMRHVDYLLHNVMIDSDTFEALAMYRRNIARAPSSHGEFGKELKDGINDLRFLLVDNYLNYIDRLIAGGAGTDSALMGWVYEFIYAADVVAESNQEEAYVLIDQLCSLIPPTDVSFRQILQIGLMLDVVMHFGGQRYDEFIDRIASSSRADFQVAAEMLKICRRIHDANSYVAAKMEIRQRLAEWGIRDDIMPQIDSVLKRYAQFKKIDIQPDPLQGQAAVFLPVLTPQTQWPVSMIRDCGDHAPDYASRDQSGNFGRMVWDGAYWWDMCDDRINVHGEGGAWSATAKELGLESFQHAVACAMDQGKIAIAGALHSKDSVTRTWIALVAISATNHTPEAEIVYEGKQQFVADKSGSNPFTSFNPSWIHYIPKGTLLAGENCLLVGREIFAQPMALSLDDYTPTVLSARWPLSGAWPRVWSSTVWDESKSRLYIATGHAYHDQWAGVYVCDDVSKPPRLFVDFGYRPFREKWVYDPHFQSMVLHDGILHLLASTSARKPNWLAVDTRSGESFQLVTAFPHPLEHMNLMSDSGNLYLSHHNELNRIDLPPQDQWVHYPPGPQDLVSFEYKNDEASQVFVAGEFNRWDSQLWPMLRNDQGLWTTNLRLQRGIYGYKFIADGQWLLDPSNDEVVRVDGHENSKLDTTKPTK